MSRHQIAGQNDNTKTDNKSFEMVGEFKYLQTTPMNQNSIQKYIKNKF